MGGAWMYYADAIANTQADRGSTKTQYRVPGATPQTSKLRRCPRHPQSSYSYFSVFLAFDADFGSGFGIVASALARPGTCSAPTGTVMVAPLKSLPIGSNRPPNCSARNASVTALNDLLFSGRWKPWPSSG